MPASPTARSLSERFDPQTLAALEGLDLKARYVMEGFLLGLHESPFHGFSVEFSYYRYYQPGDDLRHLDWRLFARTDRLCIKRYMQETNARFYVLCDTSASMAYRGDRAWGDKLEVARILAAALTWFLLRQNDAAGLVTLGDDTQSPQFIRPSQRASQFGLMLRQLDALRPAGGPRLAQLLTHAARLVHRRSIILFFSDLLEPSEDVALGFKQLRFCGHECLIFQVLDPDEIEFPFRDDKVFEDLETGARQLRDVLLFLCRVLAVLLLAGAFAWPYLPGQNMVVVKESRVYILDNTLSHQAEDAFVRARERILNDLAGAGPEVQIAVIELTSQPRVVAGFGDNRAEVRQKVKELVPSFQRGSYLAAFRQASTLLSNSLGERKRIILCGDNQENQWTENVNTPPFLHQVEIEIPKPVAVQAANLALAEPRLQRIFLGDKSLVIAP
jgi:hypothetical protein